MDDYTILCPRWHLDQKVSTYDASNNLLSDDGEYQRRGAELDYTFIQFLADKNLLKAGVTASRDPDFELKASYLTSEGLVFAKSALHKWIASYDRPPTRVIDANRLEKRWQKFKAA